ncbi:MAG: hypothetical protein AAGA21_02670 [Pseudomonadota bacterium]
MKRPSFFLISWLIAATVLLSLVGLTAEPLPASEIGAGASAVTGVNS